MIVLKKFYEALAKDEQSELKRNICAICDMAEATFSSKLRGVRHFNKLERDAITKIVNVGFQKDYTTETLFCKDNNIDKNVKP